MIEDTFCLREDGIIRIVDSIRAMAHIPMEQFADILVKYIADEMVPDDAPYARQEIWLLLRNHGYKGKEVKE